MFRLSKCLIIYFYMITSIICKGVIVYYLFRSKLDTYNNLNIENNCQKFDTM